MRRLVAGLFMVAGIAFALIATARLLFGAAMDLPFAPALSLEGISLSAAVIGAVICFAAAALIGRRTNAPRPPA